MDVAVIEFVAIAVLGIATIIYYMVGDEEGGTP